MSARAIRAVADAKKVAEFLESGGQHKRANDIRRVCRSNETYRATLGQLHRDNMALRAELAEWVPR